MVARSELAETARRTFGNYEQFAGMLLIEVWASDPNIQRKWVQNGFITLLPMAPNRPISPQHDSIATVDIQSTYGQACDNIERAVKMGRLDEDAPERALQYMFWGTFEDSDLAQYLPGQLNT